MYARLSLQLVQCCYFEDVRSNGEKRSVILDFLYMHENDRYRRTEIL